ncbi:hypothetical protein Tco_0853015 [Tanacetum coccineum]
MKSYALFDATNLFVVAVHGSPAELLRLALLPALCEASEIPRSEWLIDLASFEFRWKVEGLDVSRVDSHRASQEAI